MTVTRVKYRTKITISMYQRLLQQRFRTERLSLLHVRRYFRIPTRQNTRRAAAMSHSAGALGDASGRLAGLPSKQHFALCANILDETTKSTPGTSPTISTSPPNATDGIPFRRTTVLGHRTAESFPPTLPRAETRIPSNDSTRLGGKHRGL